MTLFKSWGLRHILNEPSGFVGHVMDETHSVGLVTGAIIYSCSISLRFFFYFLFVVNWNFATSMLHWWYC